MNHSNTSKLFKLKSSFSLKGDQPQAVEKLVQGVLDQEKAQVLLGVTGSGKTFTMANVIAAVNRPTLILCHNKTLAAQLFAEFREFFPENAVEYFVSYYDYYQPEAYVPSTDTYIEKDSSINDEIDKLRHSATRSLLERRDVIIVSSVSCIYGLGSPELYSEMVISLKVGAQMSRENLIQRLIEIQYQRNDYDFHRGTFRVRGDCVEIFPSYEADEAIRVEFFDDEIENLQIIDPLRGVRTLILKEFDLFPASHYVTSAEIRKKSIQSIREDLRIRLAELESLDKKMEATRLAQRTLYDLEMIEELGFCSGIENYSRYLTGRPAGEAPPTLLEYFPKSDWLLMVDESHVTIPQIGGMFRGDRARKMNLVEHGFRLPSALDNRPLNFEEWERSIHQVVFVSATPGDYELQQSKGKKVEQLIRPTGLLDPLVEVRPALSQVDDLLKEIRPRIQKNERVLVTTLTKKLAEELSVFLNQSGVKSKYLHSDIDTLERVEILRDLRAGLFDVLVGINLLREGLDLPEVSLVAILDADKEGFLRSARSLIQTIGRAARNANGFVILYADKMTESMSKAIFETNRRRLLQEEFNQKNGITPKTILKPVYAPIVDPDQEGQDSEPSAVRGGRNKKSAMIAARALRTGSGSGHSKSIWKEKAEVGLDDLIDEADFLQEIEKEAGSLWHGLSNLDQTLLELDQEMKQFAAEMDFEKAADLRDRIAKIKRLRLALGGA